MGFAVDGARARRQSTAFTGGALGRWFGAISELRYWPFLLIIPSLLVIFSVVLYPTINGIILSFREMRLTRPDLGTDFIALRHYVDMWNDRIFWGALANTIKWVTLATLIELTLGMICALALNRDGPLFKFYTLLVLLPWFLPNVVAANMWALMLDSRLGVINELLMRLGIIDEYVAWFAQPTSGLLTAVFIEAWHGYPFFTLLILAGLKAIPRDLYQAASVDGANSWQAWRNITMPMLRMIVVTAVILRVISLANSPELLLILTGGGPGDATQVISLYAFKMAYEYFDFGYAGALSVVTLILLMIFCVIYLRVSRVLDK